MTAEPTADFQSLPILLYDPKNLYDNDFQRKTRGKIVLVVGHSNTINVFVNNILGQEKYPEIDDKNNSNLYIVSIIDLGLPSE